MSVASLSSLASSHFHIAGSQSSTSIDDAVASAIDGIDPETATEDDLIAIRESLKESGMRPSRALGQAITDAGFTPKDIMMAGRSAGPGGSMRAGMLGQTDRGAAVFDSLQKILGDYEGQEI